MNHGRHLWKSGQLSEVDSLQPVIVFQSSNAGFCDKCSYPLGHLTSPPGKSFVHVSVILTLGKLKQEDFKIKASLGFSARSALKNEMRYSWNNSKQH